SIYPMRVCLFPLLHPPPPASPLFPYTTLFRSLRAGAPLTVPLVVTGDGLPRIRVWADYHPVSLHGRPRLLVLLQPVHNDVPHSRDRKSTRLNSSHVSISYAVFCLKKKKTKEYNIPRFFVPAPHTTFTLAHVLFPPPSPPAIQAPNAPGASPYTSLPIHPDSS